MNLNLILPRKIVFGCNSINQLCGEVKKLGGESILVITSNGMTKRASFLQFIKADLELDNVRVVKKRVEEMEPEIFELITSRAVTDTNMLLKLSEKFRDENSKLLFYKGEKVFDEVDKNLKHKIIQTKNRHYLLMGENL